MYIPLVLWYSCKIGPSFGFVIFREVECSILAVATIFDNTNNSRNFHGIHMDLSMDSMWTCSMESKVDMPLFHMQSSGIHMEWCWNPYGINHSMTIPSSFHMESMMYME
jgi:hypothetical protein